LLGAEYGFRHNEVLGGKALSNPVAAALGLLFAAFTGWSGQPLSSLTLEGSTVIARGTDGLTAWSCPVPDPGAVSIRPLPGGRFDLGNGMIVDRFGRLLSYSADGSASMAAPAIPGANTPAWSALVPVTTQNSAATIKPVFDPSDNAWTMVADGDTEVVASAGTSGAWQVPHILENGGTLAPVTATPSGSVHAVYLWLESPQAELRWQVFVPGLGWQAPVIIFSTSNPGSGGIGVPQTVSDSNNNVVVTFSWNYQIWGIVYSAATGTWGQPAALSPANTYLETLAQSPDHSHIMLVYFVPGQRTAYSRVFQPANLAFGPAVRIPGTSLAGAPAYGSYPLAVDNSGNASLVSPEYSAFTWAMFGFRYEAGQWTSSTKLLDWNRGAEATFAFHDSAVDSAGNFFAAGKIETGGINSAGEILAFRFTPGSGWRTETAAVQSPPFTGTFDWISAAWLGNSGQAVIVYLDTPFTSVVNTNGVWSNVSIPGTNSGNPNVAAQAPTGEVLLLISQNGTGTILSTWLRP
jgi:hypothetical protein